jgi:hypothetical protein
MVLDGPVLALSDIMHGIAPGPGTPVPPEDDLENIFGAGISTPEPLDNAQIELMRKRVLELIVSGASKMNTSSREKELLEMVRFFLCLSDMNSSAKLWLEGRSAYVRTYARCRPTVHPGQDHTGTLSSARFHNQGSRRGTGPLGSRETRL